MIAEIISILSLVIALLSAIYARHAVSAATHANKIAIHQERLKIYKALLAHVSDLSARGVVIAAEDVWRFYEPATLSKFYFKPEHATKIEKIFDDSLSLISKKAEWDDIRARDQDAYQALVQETHNLLRATRDGARNLTEELEPELIIT